MPTSRTTFALLLGVLAITGIAYLPGLGGPFLFDDFPNLSKLGALGPIEDWELFRAFIASGFSGPTGRPISLASFLIDARDWPAEPASFKRTNLVIHLLIGVLLFSTIRRLLFLIGRPEQATLVIPLLATALWLLNPFLVSTTLYAVQRMTQLSALFVLAGLWFYLVGRSYLQTRPVIGYLLISTTLPLATVLAVYSKENGILLPLFILTIEFALKYHWTTCGPDWRWRAVFLWTPSFALAAYLLLPLLDASTINPLRGWSVLERVLTQPRMLFDYLYHLLLPHTQTRGLYQDGIQLSTGLFKPPQTIAAIAGLLGLGVIGVLVRRRWPLIALAILFFLAGHALESTTMNLELYFEHRNYLPSLLLFVPIAAALMGMKAFLRPSLTVAIALVFVASYGLATWQRATLWGDEDLLMLVWAENNPNSPRAQNTAAQTWMRLGEYDKGFGHLEESIRRMPESSLLIANYLSWKAYRNSLDVVELQEGLDRLVRLPFDAQMLLALKHLVEIINALGPLEQHAEALSGFLESLREEMGGAVPVLHRHSYYLQGLLHSGQGEGSYAEKFFEEALRLYASTETGLHIVSVLATHGHFSEALRLLDKTSVMLETGPERNLLRQRETYLREIERLHRTLLEELADAEAETWMNSETSTWLEPPMAR